MDGGSKREMCAGAGRLSYTLEIGAQGGAAMIKNTLKNCGSRSVSPTRRLGQDAGSPDTAYHQVWHPWRRLT
jgi:hypothetical protein